MKHYLETGEELPPLSFGWKMNVLRREVQDSVNLLDERRGILHVRRHLAASPLFKGIPNFRETRIAMLRAETLEELNRILDHIEEIYGKASNNSQPQRSTTEPMPPNASKRYIFSVQKRRFTRILADDCANYLRNLCF